MYEAITHKNFYLDNVYLKYGRSNDNNLKAQFAIYSGIYNDVTTTTWNDNTIELIYEAEVLEIAKDTKYCGMWQSCCNVVCLPIRSIYPVGFVAPQYRPDLNRIAYPIQLHHREEKMLSIMWTPMRLQGQPVHFVPLVKL